MSDTTVLDSEEREDDLQNELQKAQILAAELEQPVTRVLAEQLMAYRNALRVTRRALRQTLQDAARGYYDLG